MNEISVRNDWKSRKNNLKQKDNKLGSVTTRMKLTALDGKKMTASVSDASMIEKLISNAMANKTNGREMFMKGIDYSCCHEEADDTVLTPGDDAQ